MTRSAESPFPNAVQELLLRAALSDKSESVKAWKNWRERVDFETDVDRGSLRILPLTYVNLKSNGFKDDLFGLLKGIYRKAWLENKKILYDAGLILDQFHKEGIKTLVMKGIPLTLLLYKNAGVRPMSDIDLLVPFKSAQKAIDLLKKNGYNPKRAHIEKRHLLYEHGLAFYCDGKSDIDLHWRPMKHSHNLLRDHDFWDKAVPVEVAGVPTHAFCGTDELFNTIVHGVQKNIEPPIRWVADSIQILNHYSDEIEWQRLVSFSERFRVFLQVRDAITYLKNSFDADIPDEVAEILGSLKPAYADRVIYWYALHFSTTGDKRKVIQRLIGFYAKFLRQSSETGFIHVHIGFVRYIFFRMKHLLFR